MRKPILGITIGDPSGIGPEIVLKALSNKNLLEICTPFIIGNKSVLEAENILPRAVLNDIDIFDVPTNLNQIFKGKITAEAGKASYNYILKAIGLAKERRIDAIVTSPITKECLKLASVPFIDHTEIFENQYNLEPLTLLATPELKVSHVIRHQSLKNSILNLTPEKIYSTIIQTAEVLTKYYKMKDVKLIVTGLNPHNGENGLMGEEEKDIIEPAIKKAIIKGINAIGPIPADSAFPKAISRQADCVVAMYHDQGHIAIKTNNWEKSFGITLGLPVIRTSVDHGSALDIAGQNKASEKSLIEAINEAIKLVNIKNTMGV